MAAKNESNEIKLTRVFDAPVKAVWEAWMDPKQVSQWWGPRGFTLTTHSRDAQSGGHWNYTMHGPDGVDYPNVTKYLEVEKHRRLVYDHGGNEKQPPMFRVTVLFSETPNGTKMEMTMALPSPEAASNTRKFIKKASGDSTWDRLAEYLIQASSGQETFVINRAFPAPIERMFEMWTNPRHFSQWLAPTGFEMHFIRADIRTGGDSFFVMADKAGANKMYGNVQYLEIHRPNRIVYTQRFSDEQEKPSRHPMSPTWPETMLTTVTLTEEGPDHTRVTVKWAPHGKFTEQELKTFIEGRAGMTQGWTGSFDKLEAHLESQP